MGALVLDTERGGPQGSIDSFSSGVHWALTSCWQTFGP